MTMYGSDLLPDVTGRTLGAADKQWDVYARNIILSGQLSGTGLATSSVANASPDVDTANWSSGQDISTLISRFRLTNPSVGTPVAAWKNMIMNFGGINPADSLSVPMQWFSNATESTGNGVLSIYQRGSSSALAMYIDLMGRINCYPFGYTTYALQIAKPGEANAIFLIGPEGNMHWGAGGANALDVAFTRTGAGALGLTNDAGGWGNLSLGQLISNVATGTPPLAVASATLVPNLNADHLDGADWTAPPAIGSVTPNDVHAALLTASAQIQSTINDGVTPPLSIASTVPVLNLTVKQAFDLTINDKLLNDGSGFKHKRVTTGSVAASASVNVVITWTSPFADGNYTAGAAMFDSFNSGAVGVGLRVARITQLDATHIAVMVINDDAANAHTGTIQAWGIRG